MAPETLVSFDIESGKEVIDALDRDGKAPNVALWAKLPDYESWRPIIASDKLAEDSSTAGYEEMNASIRKAGISYQATVHLSSPNGQSLHQGSSQFLCCNR